MTDRIEAYIEANKDRFIEELKQWLRFPSVSAQSAHDADTVACAQWMVTHLAAIGLDARLIDKGGKPIVHARARGKAGKPVVIYGHYDVQPEDPLDQWQSPPFEPVLRDGFIYGRGTSDMKSGVAAMIIALGALKKAGSPFHGRIVFQAVGDEETGSDAGTRCMIRRKIGAGADFAIVSEPTNLNVTIGNRGLRWLEVSVKGRASHAGRPHVGANAIHAAARMISELERLTFKAHHPLFEVPRPNLSVTMIQAGAKVNIIPERCSFSIDRRMMPGETSQSVQQEIEKVLRQFSSDGISSEVRITHEGWDPYAIDPSSPWVKALCETIQEVVGQFPQIKGKAGCTDASHLYHLGKIPSVCFGPGLENLAHAANERVALEKVVQAAKVYALSAVKLLV